MTNEEYKNLEKLPINERSLLMLNIKDLRDIGRKFGLSSPTTMKKKELVDKILKIVYGEMTIPIRNSSGRPSVREFDINKYIEKIKHKSGYVEELQDVVYGSEYGAYMVSSPSEKYDSDDNILIKTFFTDGKKNYLRDKEFIPSPDDIEVSSKFVSKFNLENFDVVEIVLHQNMFKIISINGIKVSNKFSNLSVSGETIEKGKIKDFYLGTKEEINKEILDLIKKATKVGINVVTFSVKDFSSKGANSVVYKNDEPENNIYKKLIYLANICEKELYDGEDIILIVDDEFFIEDVIENLEFDVKERLKKYISSAKDKMLELGNAICYFKIANEVIY